MAKERVYFLTKSGTSSPLYLPVVGLILAKDSPQITRRARYPLNKPQLYPNSKKIFLHFACRSDDFLMFDKDLAIVHYSSCTYLSLMAIRMQASNK